MSRSTMLVAIMSASNAGTTKRSVVVMPGGHHTVSGGAMTIRKSASRSVRRDGYKTFISGRGRLPNTSYQLSPDDRRRIRASLWSHVVRKIW